MEAIDFESLYQAARQEIEGPDEQAKVRLLEAFPTKERRPGGTTCREAASLWGVTRATAYSRLEELVAKGQMTSEEVRIGRHDTKVYYWV